MRTEQIKHLILYKYINRDTLEIHLRGYDYETYTELADIIIEELGKWTPGTSFHDELLERFSLVKQCMDYASLSRRQNEIRTKEADALARYLDRDRYQPFVIPLPDISMVPPQYEDIVTDALFSFGKRGIQADIDTVKNVLDHLPFESTAYNEFLNYLKALEEKKAGNLSVTQKVLIRCTCGEDIDATSSFCSYCGRQFAYVGGTRKLTLTEK